MSYVFQLTAYEEKKLLPQVAAALKQRTELLSRERYPGLWKQIDRINAENGGKKRDPRRTKVLSVINLVLGTLLFVPGLMKPQELLLPLLMGAVGIGAGLGGFYRVYKAKKAPKPDRFTEAAEKLLMLYVKITDADGMEILFSDSAMILPDDGGMGHIPYGSFERAVETADALLLVFDTRVMLLQKRDLCGARWESFRSFLQEKVPQVEN